MTLKSIILSAVTLVAGFLSLDAASWTAKNYQIDNLNITRRHDLLNLDMSINPHDFAIGIEKQVTIIPVVRSLDGNDSVCLTPVAVAGRNSYYSTMRDADFSGKLLRAGSGKPFSYSASTEWQDWMEHSQVSMQYSVTGCCGKPENEDTRVPVANIDFRPNTYDAVYHYIMPVDAGPKTRKLEGKAYVNFPVNRTEIFPDYMKNPQELRKITNSIDSVRHNPDATVKSITLIGFASPEGPYKNNVRLAAGRTEAVKEYVRKLYTFPSKVFQTRSVPEDWEGLRDSVAVSILPDREQILAFIDRGNVPIERRNDELRSRFPSSYDYLLKHIYPWLRHTNYVIDYEIREYTSLEEIMKVLKERPQNLSLNEFYRAANSYPVGSPEFNEIMETALVYNKDSETACVNAANVAISEGDYKRARMLLSRVKNSPAASFTTGILEAKEGNLDKAEEAFKAAQAGGIAEADEALRKLAKMKERKNPVTYLPAAN